MYYPNADLEEICYHTEHVDIITKVISSNIDDYYESFLVSMGESSVDEALMKLSAKFNSNKSSKAKKMDKLKKDAEDYFDNAIKRFEEERDPYLEILSQEALLI